MVPARNNNHHGAVPSLVLIPLLMLLILLSSIKVWTHKQHSPPDVDNFRALRRSSGKPAAINSGMKSGLAVNPPTNAVRMRGSVAGCVVLSDRGSQRFLRALTYHRIVGSMEQSRILRGQRSDGIVLRPVAEERPQPPSLSRMPALQLDMNLGSQTRSVAARRLTHDYRDRGSRFRSRKFL